MATRPTNSQARLFAQLLAEFEPQVRRAFMASVTDLQAGVDWSALLAALARRDVSQAVSALNISAAAWDTYSATVTAAYAKSGAATALQVTQQKIATVGTRFEMSNPRAQAWIRENVASSVTGFVEEQVRVARDVIEAGYARGQGPRNIAVDLVGRASGGSARTGGVLGLDGPRAERLRAVTEGMETAEGVRRLVVVHVDGTHGMRYKVNPATAQRIIKAYRAGTAVPESERVISEKQYSNALLKARADTVAITETAGAVMGARQEEWVQLAESRGLTASAVIKTWRHRRGAVEGRPDHIALSGVSVVGLYTPFVLADGTRMQHPHDVAGGAKQNINCGCDCDYRLDHFAGIV